MDTFNNIAETNNSLSMCDQLEKDIATEKSQFSQKTQLELDQYQKKYTDLLSQLKVLSSSTVRFEQSSAKYILNQSEIIYKESFIQLLEDHITHQNEYTKRIKNLSSTISTEIEELIERINLEENSQNTSTIIQDLGHIVQHKKAILGHLNSTQKTLDKEIEESQFSLETTKEQLSPIQTKNAELKEIILTDISTQYVYIKGEIAYLYTTVHDTVTKNPNQLNKYRLEVGKMISRKSTEQQNLDKACRQINDLCKKNQIVSFLDPESIERREIKVIEKRISEIDNNQTEVETYIGLESISPITKEKHRILQEEIISTDETIKQIEKDIIQKNTNEVEHKDAIDRIVKEDHRSFIRKLLFSNRDLSRLKYELSIILIEKKKLLEKKDALQHNKARLIVEQSEIKEQIENEEQLEKEILLLRKKIIETQEPIK